MLSRCRSATAARLARRFNLRGRPPARAGAAPRRPGTRPAGQHRTELLDRGRSDHPARRHHRRRCRDRGGRRRDAGCFGRGDGRRESGPADCKRVAARRSRLRRPADAMRMVGRRKGAGGYGKNRAPARRHRHINALATPLAGGRWAAGGGVTQFVTFCDKRSRATKRLYSRYKARLGL